MITLISLLQLDYHGVGFSPKEVGIVFFIFGVIAFIFQVKFFKMLIKRWKLVRVYKLGLWSMIVSTFLFPFPALFPWLMGKLNRLLSSFFSPHVFIFLLLLLKRKATPPLLRY
jgi:predicted MFS family arabinose efflux permease